MNLHITTDHHRFEVLDGMRGIAALLVMILHYNLDADYGVVSNFFENIFMAVDFFFVLSGFVVSYAYADKLRNGLSAKDYLIKRFARLYPLAVAGMVIGVPAFYWEAVNGGTQSYFVNNMVEILGSNLLFLPYCGSGGGTLRGIFPIDGQLWTIFFKMFASVAFIWLVRQTSCRLAWIAGASFVGLILAAELLTNSGFDINLGYRQENFFGGFPRGLFGFVCGMLLYRLWEAKPIDGVLGALQRPRVRTPALLYLGLFLTLCCPFYLKGLYRFFVLLVAAPYLVVQGSQAQCRSAAMRRASRFLGWISYPVYCLHRPVGYEITLLHTQGILTTNVPLQAIAVPATLLTSVLVAAAFDRLKVQQRLRTALTTVMPDNRC